MATSFSPCRRSYVLNQFPSNVMFGMNGFHVSASGAIQGHHGPLVSKEFISFIGFLDKCQTSVFNALILLFTTWGPSWLSGKVIDS